MLYRDYKAKGRPVDRAVPPCSEQNMSHPPRIDVVRRAYQLWQEAGEPEGRDDEFYLQAEQELAGAQEQEAPEKLRQQTLLGDGTKR
jgi:DUF2934 family protein